MTIYEVTKNGLSTFIAVEHGTVFKCGTPIKVLHKHDWQVARNWLEQNQWKIVPELDDNAPVSVQYGDELYRFSYHGNTLVRITRYSDGEEVEVRYSDVPEIVKGLI